jgi:hypothetical protein
MNGLVVVFRLLASWLVGRIGTWSAVLLSIGIACTGFLGTPFSSQVFVGTIALTITAVGLTPLVATFISIGNERAGTWFGSTSGLLLFVIGISNALCSWLFGVILYHAGSTWAVLFCLVSMSCGGIIVLWLRLDAIPTPAGQ